MAKQIIKNCVITHTDAVITKTYNVRSGLEEYHLGVDVEAENVYCPCYGVCIYNGLLDNKPSCTVQYSENICLRFTHLREVLVEPGDLVTYDQQIALADEYVHFEYLTSEQSYPYFRVFFCCEQSYYLYKHDPMLILSGNTVFDNTPRLEEPAGLFTSLYEDGLGPGETIGWAEL